MVMIEREIETGSLVLDYRDILNQGHIRAGSLVLDYRDRSIVGYTQRINSWGQNHQIFMFIALHIMVNSSAKLPLRAGLI